MRLPAKYRPLEPYFKSEPRDDGEADLYCPLHTDLKRSATINIQKGVWNCFAGCGGGKVEELLEQRDTWVAPPSGNGSPTPSSSSKEPLPSTSRIEAWCEALFENEGALERFQNGRGLTRDTIEKYKLGWDDEKDVYTIPVYDEDGKLLTVRFYNMSRTGTKIWHLRGRGGPYIFPLPSLNQSTEMVVICEGELDALINIQAGFPTFTRTGGANVWRPGWNHRFKGKIVYLAHDCDKEGQQANIKVGTALLKHAEEVRVLRLPYPITDKHGKDLTDFWLENGGTSSQKAQARFRQLLDDAQLFDPELLVPRDIDPTEAHPADAINAELHGKPLRLTLTVKGRARAGYAIPHKVTFSCSQDAGAMCAHCPMMETGLGSLEVSRNEPNILRMMGSKSEDVDKYLKYMAEIPTKCPKVKLDKTFQSVEVLYARPSVEHSNGTNGSRLNSMDTVLKLTSVGRHDTPSNCTVQVVGAVQNNPRNQENEFLAWDVTQMRVMDTDYELDDETYEMLKVFQPADDELPLHKLRDIANEMAKHVTHIYGRTDLHIAMDLVWHSILQFKFGGQLLDRGWLELLVVGDTRTGKSEAAKRLISHYGAGELINCETASLPGLVGGVQQMRNEWMLTWGAIPINDRRLVVLDEISGLTVEQIGQMSDMRASGIAAIEKVVSDKTPARARKIWMGNPRDDISMSHYAFGIYAIKPLIGRNEDIARFDIAMSLRSDDVEVEHFLNGVADSSRLRYTREASSALVRWAWTRKPSDVIWDTGAQEEVLRLSIKLGQRYNREPPLVLRQDIRIKLARIAVSIAARLFSTREGREVVVRPEHARSAFRVLDSIYGSDSFGYRYLSNRRTRASAVAKSKEDEAVRVLDIHPELGQFLLGLPEGRFFSRDLEEVLSMNREGVNSIINSLLGISMFEKERGFVVVMPELQDLLRRRYK